MLNRVLKFTVIAAGSLGLSMAPPVSERGSEGALTEAEIVALHESANEFRSQFDEGEPTAGDRPPPIVRAAEREPAAQRDYRSWIEEAAISVQFAAEAAIDPEHYTATYITQDEPPSIIISSTQPYPRLMAEMPRNLPVEWRRSTVSLRALTATADALQMSTARAGRVGELLDDAGIEEFDISVEPIDERVVVRVAEQGMRAAATEGSTSFSRESGGLLAPVELESGRGEPTCSRANCRPDMMAGLTFQRQLGTNGCTSGFVMLPNSSSVAFTTSAGHCIGTARFHGSIRYGTVVDEVQNGPVDAERINRTSGTWNYRGRMWLQAGDFRAITSSITHQNIVLGTQVGKSGRTTGTTRGHIDAKDFRPGYVPSAFNFVTANGACTRDGDSGGPVFRNNQAYGLTSGSINQTCNGGHKLIFGSAGYIRGAFDARFFFGG